MSLTCTRSSLSSLILSRRLHRNYRARSIPNNTVGELEHAYRLEDNIIKFLTVHLEKELVPRRVDAPSEELTGGRV